MDSGFMYVRDDKPGRMAGAGVGDRVAMPEPKPPWLVVMDTLEAVGVSSWPGKLLRVEVVPPESRADRRAVEEANDGVRDGAGYVRAMAVEVLEELPVAELFGPRGAEVAAVLEAARELTEESAGRLAVARDPQAGEIYSMAWARWLAEQPTSDPYLYRDHQGVVLIPGAGPSGSPVGQGLSALSWVVRETAASQGRPGTQTVVIDGDTGEQETVLTDRWADACQALLEAVMALGAPQLLDEEESAALTAAWDAVIAQD